MLHGTVILIFEVVSRTGGSAVCSLTCEAVTRIDTVFKELILVSSVRFICSDKFEVTIQLDRNAFLFL